MGYSSELVEISEDYFPFLDQWPEGFKQNWELAREKLLDACQRYPLPFLHHPHNKPVLDICYILKTEVSEKLLSFIFVSWDDLDVVALR